MTDYDKLYEPLWEAIVKVRDAHPRIAEDAPTDQIVEAVIEVLKSYKEAEELQPDQWDEERRFVEEALEAADSGSAGHWPTVAAYLAAEVRRLRGELQPDPMDEMRAARHHYVTWEENLRRSGVDGDTILMQRHKYVQDALKNPEAIRQLREMYP